MHVHLRVAAFACLLILAAVLAQSYPVKPIRPVMAVSGGAEVVVRIASPRWQETTGHPIALIDDPTVVRRILEHLGRWAPEPAERGPPVEAPDWPPNAVIPITYHPVQR